MSTMSNEQEKTAENIRANHRIHPENGYSAYSNNKGEQSLGELFVLLSEDLSTLVHKEIELVRTEANEKLTQVTSATTNLLAGVGLLLIGTGALVAAAILALGAVFVYWISALMIGVLVLLIGLILVQSGRANLRTFSLIPQKSINSIKKDTESLLEKMQ